MGASVPRGYRYASYEGEIFEAHVHCSRLRLLKIVNNRCLCSGHLRFAIGTIQGILHVLSCICKSTRHVHADVTLIAAVSCRTLEALQRGLPHTLHVNDLLIFMSCHVYVPDDKGNFL